MLTEVSRSILPGDIVEIKYDDGSTVTFPLEVNVAGQDIQVEVEADPSINSGHQLPE